MAERKKTMAYKKTGHPVGRPRKDDKLEVTFSFKADKALMDRVKAYAWQRRLSVAELIREGLEWRLEEGDPLAHHVYGLHERVTNGNEYSGNTESDIQDDKKYSGNTENSTPAMTLPLEGALENVEEIPAFDQEKYFLGALCSKGHRHPGTDQSLRRIAKRDCHQCDLERKRRQARKRQRAL